MPAAKAWGVGGIGRKAKPLDRCPFYLFYMVMLQCPRERAFQITHPA